MKTSLIRTALLISIVISLGTARALAQEGKANPPRDCCAMKQVSCPMASHASHTSDGQEKASGQHQHADGEMSREPIQATVTGTLVRLDSTASQDAAHDEQSEQKSGFKVIEAKDSKGNLIPELKNMVLFYKRGALGKDLAQEQSNATVTVAGSIDTDKRFIEVSKVLPSTQELSPAQDRSPRDQHAAHAHH